MSCGNPPGGDLEEPRKLDSAGWKLPADPYKEILAERFLERMISRRIDVNDHVIAGSGQPPPRDSYARFTELGKMGLLEPEVAPGIAGAAGLRTPYEYDEIEPEKVFDAIRIALADPPVCLKAASSFIGRPVPRIPRPAAKTGTCPSTRRCG